MTARDLAIIEAVYGYRVLTSAQIEALLFAQTSVAQCRNRLRLLFAHGYLYRAEQLQRRSDGTRPYLYFLDKKGAQELAKLYHCEVKALDWNKEERHTGYLHLAHLLATQDIRIAMTRSAQVHGFVIGEWRDEKTLRRDHRDDRIQIPAATHPGDNAQGERADTTHVIPDGFFVLETPKKRYHRFIEIDLSTVTGFAQVERRRDWHRKIAAYLSYYRSGKYHARYHVKAMGVLTITTSEKRLENLKRITEEAGGRQRFAFCTFERIQDADILTDPIWSVATVGESRAIVAPRS